MMRYKVQKIAFAAFTFLFTMFVFLNTYEVVFNKDIAFASSIRKVSSQKTINSAIEEFATKNQTDEINASGSLDTMEYLEIPSLNIRLRVEESRKIGTLWYERPGALHRIGLNKNQHGATIDYVLYGTASWRSITDPDRIEKGVTANVVYNGGSSSLGFTVTDKKVLPIGQSLIVDKSESRQLLLIIEEPDEHVFYGYSMELEQ